MKKEKKYKDISSSEKAALVCEWLDEKQGEDIVTMDVAGLCSITETICVVSARSLKHGQALADFVLEKCREEGIEFLGMEGYKPGDWILVDLNDMIIHVFQSELRDFYNIEGMWSEAERRNFCGEKPRE
ncbi:ribosome silencing factor [Salidesulfovibrio onnuriiensis]|uniref:ribosome silencing factor n=1 Tax=Salidesulfovibrio onnuriiensis TaxID=2583823 RepID=UPI0011CBBEA1|nr:ribosome silencing factor [Salidesulfovibrio onnuriiensis]